MSHFEACAVSYQPRSKLNVRAKGLFTVYNLVVSAPYRMHSSHKQQPVLDIGISLVNNTVHTFCEVLYTYNPNPCRCFRLAKVETT